MRLFLMIIGLALAPVALAQEARDPGPGKVHNEADNTWSYADRGLRVGTTKWEGDILWQYVSMTHMSYRDVPDSNEIFINHVATGTKPSREERILGSQRHDGYGQKWVAIDVAFTTDETYYDLIGPDDEDFVGFYYPQSWTYIYCSSSGNDGWIEGDESRSLWSSLSSDRHYRVVKLTSTNPGTSNTEACTGIQMGPTDILTNAHCITDSAGDLNTINSICSRGNNSSYTGADCVSTPPGGFNVTLPPGGYVDDTNPADDYALIQWTNGLSSDAQILNGLGSSAWEMSTLSDGDLENENLATYGYPIEYFPDEVNCTATTGGAAADPSQNSASRKLHKEWDSAGGAHWMTSDKLKTNMDCSDGQSGAAYFVCPTNSGSCANGEELVGLHSGSWQPVFQSRYCGGPKVATFADFVDANL